MSDTNQYFNIPPADLPISDATQAALDNKINTTTQLTTSAPLMGGGYLSNGLNLYIPIANGSIDGYLRASDYTFFFNKQSALPIGLSTDYLAGNQTIMNFATNARAAISLTTTGSGAATYSSSTGILNIPTVSVSYPVTSVFSRTGAIVATSGDYNTSQVTENTNLYFTNARARSAVSITTTGTGASTYSSTTGVFNIPTPVYPVTSFNGRTGAIVPTSTDYNTAQVIESSNLYYTDTRARGAISVTTTGTGAATYSNTTGILNVPTPTYPVTSVFGRTGTVTATSGDYTTTQVTEGTNLYYTDTRARSSLSVTNTGSGNATYTSSTGVLNIPGNVTSVDGSTGAITLSGTYHKQGGNAYGTGTVATMGNTSTSSYVRLIAANINTLQLNPSNSTGGTVSINGVTYGDASVEVNMPTNSGIAYGMRLSSIGDGDRPGIIMQCTRSTGGGAAFPLLQGYINQTGFSRVLAGQVGVLCNAGNPSTATYMYFGCEASGAFNTNTLRLYPDSSATFFGTLTITTAATTAITGNDILLRNSSTGLINKIAASNFVSNNIVTVTGSTQQLAVNSIYIVQTVVQPTLTLPTTATVGDLIEIRGQGVGGFKIAQNALQFITGPGTTTTIGTSGFITGNSKSTIYLRYVNTNEWMLDLPGTLTYA